MAATATDIDKLVALARRYAQQGWSPATSGNYSIRSAPEQCLITASGSDKTALGGADLLTLDLDGRCPDGRGKDARRASAESRLHLMLYRHDPAIGAVLHTHSPAGTVLSRLLPAHDSVTLADYELLKAFTGIDTHDTRLVVPIVENSQDVPAMAAHARERLEQAPTPCFGFLIRGHGLYAWGRRLDDAARHVEAFEYLLGCELETLRHRGAQP